MKSGILDYILKQKKDSGKLMKFSKVCNLVNSTVANVNFLVFIRIPDYVRCQH